MIDRMAIQMVRWVAWVLLLGGLGLVVVLLLLIVRTDAGWLSPLALTACGIGLGAAFGWALLILLAMNADNLARLREALEADTPQPPP